jgi:DSF synthase
MNISRRPGIEVIYHERARCVVIRFEADGVPSCTLDVVTSMHSAYDDVAEAKAQGFAISYLMLSSNMEGIFNMGGDLAMMSAMARAGDRSGLAHYGRMTAGLVHRTWDGLGQDIPTISAVDGDAFGGGCEAAFSCNYTAASRASRFAFPETRFGLWPGMGATSLVGRRVSPAYASNIIYEGTTLSGHEALKKGLIDRVVMRNTERTVLSALIRSGRLGETRLTELARMRRRHARYHYDEAMEVVAIWVDAVLSAPERTLNHIDRIVKAQVSRLGRMSTKMA